MCSFVSSVIEILGPSLAEVVEVSINVSMTDDWGRAVGILEYLRTLVGIILEYLQTLYTSTIHANNLF